MIAPVPRAIVCHVSAVETHPNADRLEIIHLSIQGEEPLWSVVAGRHYATGQMGVYIPAGLKIPGYLALDLWLATKGGSDRLYEVAPKKMRGVLSSGLFCGAIYCQDAEDERSIERYQKHRTLQSEWGSPGWDLGPQWVHWTYWQSHWRDGDDVTDYFGIQ